MKHIYFIVIFLLLYSTITGCFQEPKITKIKKVEIVGSKDGNVELDVYSLIKNPNFFRIKASSIKMQFFIENENIGNGTIDSTIVLERKSISEVKVKNILKIEKLSKFFPIITKSDSFAVNIHVNAKFTSLKLPIKKEFIKYINSEEMINGFMSDDNIKENIKIKKIQSIQPQFDETLLKIVFEFKNIIPIDYKISKISAKIYDNKKMQTLLGSSENNKKIVIKKNSKVDIPFTIKMQNKNTAKIMFSKFIRMDRKFYLSGKVYIEIGKNKFEIPIKKEIEAPLPQFNN